MKHFFKTSALALLVLAASCSKDEKDSSGEEIAKEQEANEMTPIAAALVSDNVLIEGATKETGALPTPNNAISLDVSNTSKTAFLYEGFEISLGSDANVVGAYIQFKGNDGTLADSYYDVNIAANTSAQTSKRGVFSKKGKQKSLTSKVDDIVLDVDFGTKIEPGTFCYTICVYDAQNNISAAEEVCLTVESWGGNNDLVAAWELARGEITQEGETEVTNIGEEDCFDKRTVSCDNGMSFESEGCTTIDLFNITLKNDGTYEYKYEETHRFVAGSLSQENCSAVYITNKFVYNSSGNWAYISGEDRLVLIEYKYDSVDVGQVDSEEFSLGEGEELYDVKIESNGNNFSFTDNIDYEDDGIIDRLEKYFFQK